MQIAPVTCWYKREMQRPPTAQPSNPFLRTHATVMFTFCANTQHHKYKQQPSWPPLCVAWLPGLRGRSFGIWLASISGQLSRAPVCGLCAFNRDMLHQVNSLPELTGMLTGWGHPSDWLVWPPEFILYWIMVQRQTHLFPKLFADE